MREPTPATGDVLVIDDSSPDGTGELADELAADAAVAARAAPAAQGGPRARLPRRLPLGARARLRLRARDGLRLLARSRAPIPSLLAPAQRGRRPRARLALLPGRRRRELGPRAAPDLDAAAACTRARCSACGVRDLTGGFKCFRRARARGDRARRGRRAGLPVPDRDDLPRAAARLHASWRCRSRSPTAWPAARRCRARSCFEAMRRVPLLRLAGRARAAAARPRNADVRRVRRLLDSSDAAPRTPRDRRGRGRSRARRLCRRSRSGPTRERPQVTGAPQQWYRTSAPQVLVPVEHAGNLGEPARARSTAHDARGQAAHDRQRASCSSSTTSPTARTACASQAQPEPRLRRHASTRRSRSTSTRTSPTLALDQRPPGWQPASELSGRVEPGSTLALSYAGKRRRSCIRAAARSRSIPKLPDGRTTVRLIAQRPRPATARVITRTVAVDRTPPRVAHRPRPGASSARAHPTLRGSLDDASPVIAAGDARRRLGRAARARRQARCSATRRSRAASRCRCSTSPRACTRSRSRRPTRAGNTSTAEAGPFTVDSTEKLRAPTRAVARRPRRRRRAARAPAQGVRHLQGAVHALLQRAHRGRRAARSRATHDLPVTGIATPAGAAAQRRAHRRAPAAASASS